MRALIVSVFVFTEAISAVAGDTGKVFIYRESRFMGSGLRPTVMLNGRDLVNIESGTYYVGAFTPGEYEFKMDDGKSGARITVQPGSSHYFKVDIIPGFWKGGGRLTLIQPEQGAFEVMNLKPLPASEIVDLTYSPHVAASRAAGELTAIAQAILGAADRRGFPAAIPGSAARLLNNRDLVDPWGTPYKYVRAEDGRSFMLACAGADRTFDKSSWGQDLITKDLTADYVVRGDLNDAKAIRRWEISTK